MGDVKLKTALSVLLFIVAALTLVSTSTSNGTEKTSSRRQRCLPTCQTLSQPVGFAKYNIYLIERLFLT